MDQVHIKNFKSLEDIHLNCGNLIAFIGENNSGKSNVLEALDLLAAIDEFSNLVSIDKNLEMNFRQTADALQDPEQTNPQWW